MSYNTAIPIITDPILQSSQQIKANFQAINAAFADNHVGLTRDPLLSGKHSVLTLQPQSGDPTTSATEVAFYNKLVSSVPELFYRPSNSLTPIQMTYPSLQTGVQSTNPDVYFAQQYSFAAGPFIIYGGLIKAPTNNQTVPLSPGTTLLYVDLIVTNPSSNLPATRFNSAAPTSITGTSFNISYQNIIAGTIDVYYFAIGV